MLREIPISALLAAEMHVTRRITFLLVCATRGFLCNMRKSTVKTVKKVKKIIRKGEGI